VGVDEARLSNAVRERYPGVPFVISSGGDGSGTMVVNLAGSVVAVMQVPASLPDGWRAAAQRAAMHWPEAEAAFRRHRSHIRVSILGNREDRLQAARVVTGVIGALVASHPPCSGVLWDLEVANSRETVIDLSRYAFAAYPEFPSALWVSIHPFQDPGTTVVGAVTVGLKKFVGREIEMDGPAAKLKKVLMTERGLVAYLLQPSIKVSDGDTVGGSTTERITVRLRDSRRFEGLPVFAASLSGE
jgi:hypothetical protein